MGIVMDDTAADCIEDIEIDDILAKLTDVLLKYSKIHSPIKNFTPLAMNIGVNFLGNLVYIICENGRASEEDYRSLSFLTCDALAQFFSNTIEKALKDSKNHKCRGDKNVP